MAFIRASVIQYDAIPLKCNIAVCDHRGIVGLILLRFACSRQCLIISQNTVIITAGKQSILRFAEQFVRCTADVAQASLQLGGANRQHFHRAGGLRLDRLADHQAIQRNHDQEEPNRNTKIP